MALKIVKVTDSKTSEQFESLGLKAFEAGDLETATANMLSALELNDKNAALYLKLGVILIQQGQVDKALIAIKRSLELDPFISDAYNAMGVVLYRLELWGAAEKFFRRTLALEPTHASAKKSLVEVMKQRRAGDNELPENFETVMALLEQKEPTLSLCMIVKNEEEFLEDCLASVRDVVDEIIIVDTGSTDRTLEIAQRFNAKIFHYAWHDDFAAARNESLMHATSDWILVLDADETIPAEYHGELKKATRNKDNVGYSVVIENLLGADGESRQMAMIFRLFQNLPDMRYEGIIHEQIILAAQRTGMPIGTTQTRIMHRGYLNQYLDQRDKHQRNLAILLEQEKQEPENPYVYFNLGQTYKLLNRYEEAEQNFQRSLELLKHHDYPHAIAYYANLYFSFIELYRIMSESEKGLALCDEAIKHYPTYPDILFSKGHILLNQGRLDEAIKCFEACRKFQGVVFAAGNDPSIATYKSSNALGVAYSRQGKPALAKQHFQRALKEWGYADSETYTNLGIIHLQEGGLSQAMDCFTKAIETNDRYFRAWFNLGTICYRLEQYQEAYSAWLRARDIEPETPELNFLLGEALLKLGRHQAAAHAFEQELLASPQLDAARISLGLAYLGLGDPQKARAAWLALEDRETSEARFRAEARVLAAYAGLLAGEAITLPSDEAVSTKRSVELWLHALKTSFLAERYADVEKALLAIRAVELPGLAYAVGHLLYQQGLHEAAILFLLKAREEATEAPEVYYLLGECAAAGGNAEDARIMYELSLSLNPRLSLARQKLARLPATQAI